MIRSARLARLRDRLTVALVALCLWGSAGGAGSPARAQSAPAPPLYHSIEQRGLTALAKRTFAQMQEGKLDSAAFSPDARKLLDDEQLATAAQQLQGLGDPVWSYLGEYHPPTGPAPQIYLLKFSAVSLRLEIALDRDGRITNFFLSPSPD